MLHFIKEHKLGKVLNETGRSGYATYQKVAFDLARLANLIRKALQNTVDLPG